MGPELTRPRGMPSIIPINTIEKEDPRCVRGARSATMGTRIQGESLAAADEKGEDFEEKQIGGQCEAQGQECGHKKRGGDELASVDRVTQGTDWEKPRRMPSDELLQQM